MLKIVHTEASCGWGGQEIRILEESRGMIKRGHEVQLLCPRESTIFLEAKKYGITANAMSIDKKKISSIIQARKWIKSNNIDIINTHSSTDSWIITITCLFLKEPPTIIRTRHISAPVTNNIINRWLYKKATHKIITTGNFIRDHLINTLEIHPSMISSIPTGIDPSRFKPSNSDHASTLRMLGLPSDKTHYIGIIATLRSWKGHKYLIDAFSQISNRSWKLIIVGDGPQMDNISRQIKSLNLESQVICAGHQENPENWLQVIDIFCLPSYANEGVPQSIIQAMFCGLPIITTDAGAISEVIDDKHSGIIVNKKDAQDLYRALVKLIEDGSLRESLGKNALKSSKPLNLTSMLDKVETLFCDSINQKPPISR